MWISDPLELELQMVVSCHGVVHGGGGGIAKI